MTKPKLTGWRYTLTLALWMVFFAANNYSPNPVRQETWQWVLTIAGSLLIPAALDMQEVFGND